jgi:hypothetical protein
MYGRSRQVEGGPFLAHQIRSGDPYELSQGEPIHCLPAGGSGSGPNGLGVSVVGWDPSVTEAGVDTGYSPAPNMLRAPDVAVGNVPNKPGWVQGAPSLAIEYADVGQDEEALQRKIEDLLDAGTQFLWVVRLAGPRRVEVHRPGEAMKLVRPGEYLSAPGVLKNPVLVEALYDRDAAERATLINLLQRQGFEDLDAVLRKGREEGLAQARRALRRVLDHRKLAVPPDVDARIEACRDLEQLDAWLARALDARSAADVFEASR